MRIAFYAPFKPLDHPNPSGDQMIARGIVASLKQQGHEVRVISRLRCRWIYWSPRRQLEAIRERQRILKELRSEPVDCWLTYHCYYKSPDILGPFISKSLKIPYIIYQGSYATKFRRQWVKAPGFLLNRRALLHADHHICDRRHDLINLQRLIRPEKISFIRPGIQPDSFSFDEEAGREMRADWGSGERPVIVTAAMFRPDVKSRGVAWVIDACTKLYEQNISFQLVIAGDGPEKERLQRKAGQLPGDLVVFTGKLKREEMYRLYSGGDIFAFPGFNESLGMVYLEAQSCGLPVVACDNGGVPEVVAHNQTGLLSDITDESSFTEHLQLLIKNHDMRLRMGKAAASRVRDIFDQDTNHSRIGKLLARTVTEYNQQHRNP